MIQKARAKKLWVSHSGFKWPPPRLIQLFNIVYCAVISHNFGRWRIETDDWFEYVDEPRDWAWRCCSRCGRIESVGPKKKWRNR